MPNIMSYPVLVFVAAHSVALWAGCAGWAGGLRRDRRACTEEDQGRTSALVVGATLGLLGLIIGFSFSMAIGAAMILRKSYEEAEANAIGTEYVRADLLPQADWSAQVRDAAAAVHGPDGSGGT